METNDAIYKQVQIIRIVAETPEAKTFELAALGGWQPDYQAGQFLTLVFNKGSREDRRSYSFSSAPAIVETMQITIKRIANGEYSRKLIDHARVGDILNTTGVAGFFKLPVPAQVISGYFFLAAGSGITPVFSMIKTILFTTDLPVMLVYSNASEKETIFYQELLSLSEKFTGRFKIKFLFSRIHDISKSRLSKWLLTTLLQTHGISLETTLFYMCGPVGYMLTAGITLITAGVPSENIRKETFNTRQHLFRPQPPDIKQHQVEVQLHNNTYRFEVQYPDTILAAAKRKKIPLPYSCEAGNCGSCAATCTSGHVWMAYNEVLMDDEIDRGKVLTCQGYPVGGDVMLNFDAKDS